MRNESQECASRSELRKGGESGHACRLRMLRRGVIFRTGVRQGSSPEVAMKTPEHGQVCLCVKKGAGNESEACMAFACVAEEGRPGYGQGESGRRGENTDRPGC